MEEPEKARTIPNDVLLAIIDRNTQTEAPKKRAAVLLATKVVMSYAQNLQSPEGVIAAMAAQFEDFPGDVCEAVADYSAGIVSRSKFCPSAAEVRFDLEAETSRRNVLRVRAERAVREKEIRARFPTMFAPENE